MNNSYRYTGSRIQIKHACGANCIFKGKTKIHREYVAENCPCRTNINRTNRKIYICYTTFSKSLNEKFYSEKFTEFKPEDVSFCYDHSTIFDSSYDVYFKDKIGATGFEKIYSIETLMKSLNCLYWFSSMELERKNYIRRLMQKFIDRKRKANNIETLKVILKSVLNTINGMVIKIMQAFPRECNVIHLNQSFQSLFIAFLHDYVKEESRNILEKYILDNSIFRELKDFFKQWKMNFQSESFRFRVNILNYIFKNSSLEDFFRPFIDSLVKRINNHYMQTGYDFTESIVWDSIGATMSVTRTLGYLPKYLAVGELLDYLQEMEKVDTIEVSNLKRTANSLRYYLHKHKEELPQGIMREAFISDKTLKEVLFERNEDVKDIISRTNMDLKHSASYTKLVEEGGKLEDARILINLARKNNWYIIIRDLNNGKILTKETYNMKPELLFCRRNIYWISFQLMVNSLYKHLGIEEFKKFYEPYYDDGKEIEYDIRKATVITIKEPGKSRLLIKSQSILVWGLSIYNKLIQNSLSLIKEHEVGLISSSNMWYHYKRIGPDSKESYFIYDENDKFKKDIVHCCQDWTRSTDYINLELARVLLSVFTDYIGIPKFLSSVCVIASTTETLYEVPIRIRGTEHLLTGKFVRGMMMGNPVTKTCLHLIHCASEILGKSSYAQSVHTMEGMNKN